MTKKLSIAGLIKVFTLVKGFAASKSEVNTLAEKVNSNTQGLQHLTSDLHNIEETFATAMNNVDVMVDERFQTHRNEIELTLATVWDDMDRRINAKR